MPIENIASLVWVCLKIAFEKNNTVQSKLLTLFGSSVNSCEVGQHECMFFTALLCSLFMNA